MTRWVLLVLLVLGLVVVSGAQDPPTSPGSRTAAGDPDEAQLPPELEAPEFYPPEFDIPGESDGDVLRTLTGKMTDVAGDLERYETGKSVQKKQASIVEQLDAFIAKLESQNST